MELFIFLICIILTGVSCFLEFELTLAYFSHLLWLAILYLLISEIVFECLMNKIIFSKECSNIRYNLHFLMKKHEDKLDTLENYLTVKHQRDIETKIWRELRINNVEMNRSDLREMIHNGKVYSIIDQDIPQKSRKTIYKLLDNYETNQYFRSLRSDYESNKIINPPKEQTHSSTILSIFAIVITFYKIEEIKDVIYSRLPMAIFVALMSTIVIYIDYRKSKESTINSYNNGYKYIRTGLNELYEINKKSK